jgi:predicted nuclease of predicted toxin-antitoxin system
MRTVQLDKNCGSRNLLDACNEQGLVQCHLVPQPLRDTGTDQEIAEYAIQHKNLILTFDRKFCCEAASVLAGRSPGLLLLRADRGSARQMNTKTAGNELSIFKIQFPQWHTVPWNNSFVELTPSLIFVFHTLEPEPVSVGLPYYPRQPDGWQQAVQELLEANARGAPGKRINADK